MSLEIDAEEYFPSLEEFEGKARSFWEEFHTSKDAHKLTSSVVTVANAGINLGTLIPEIVGLYCEEMAGLYVQSKKKSEGFFVISPSDTHWIYKQFHPTAPTYSLCDLEPQIFGITSPDGLIFRRGKKYLQLVGICEYTCLKNVGKNRKKQAQLEHYKDSESIAATLGLSEGNQRINNPSYGQKLRTLLDIIRPDIPNLPISLANAWEIVYAIPAESDEKRGSLPFLPFNRQELGRYISLLMKNISPNNYLNGNQFDDNPYRDFNRPTTPKFKLISLFNREKNHSGEYTRLPTREPVLV